MESFLLNIPRNPVTAVGLPLALGLFTRAGTRNVVSSTWYRNLSVPPGRPPRWVLPIIWVATHITMGYASHLAIRHNDSAVSSAVQATIQRGLGWYYSQLILSVAGCPVFINPERPIAPFVDAIGLIGTTLHMMKLLHDGTGGATTPFLAPYCAWLCLVVYINGGIYWFNRGRRRLPPALD